MTDRASAMVASSLVHSPALAAVNASLGKQLIAAKALAPPRFSANLHATGLVKSTPAAAGAPVGPHPAPDVTGLVTRREAAMRPPIATGLAVGRDEPLAVTRTLGPYPGAVGNFWLDLHPTVGAIRIFHASFSEPIAVVTRGALPALAKAPVSALELSGGTIWLLARSLVPGAPKRAYVGFTVSSGRVEFAKPAHRRRMDLRLAGALNMTITGVPADTAAAASAGARATMQPPAHLSVRWTGGRNVVDAGGGQAHCYGHTVSFASAANSFAYDAELATCTLPYARLSPDRFDSGDVKTPLMDVTGAQPVTGQWLLPLYTPSHLTRWTESSGAGAWQLELTGPIIAHWLGASRPVTLNAPHVVVAGAAFWLTSRDAGPAGAVHELALWQPSAGSRVPGKLELPANARFAFGSSAAGDAVFVSCSATLPNDRPCDVSALPLALGRLDDAELALKTTHGGAPTVTVTGTRAIGSDRRTVALHDALVAAADPIGLALSGTAADGRDLAAGECRIAVPVFGWIPTLPDPYVTSASPTGGIFDGHAGTARTIHAVVTWGDGHDVRVNFAGDLAAPTVELGHPSAPQLRSPPVGRDPRVPTQLAQGRRVITKQGATAVHNLPLSSEPGFGPATKSALAASTQARAALAGLATVPTPASPVRLLDVSGASDFIGVEVGTAGATFSLQGDAVLTPLSNASIFMLPQVQWEPLRTLAIDQKADHPFPDRLLFLDDGGPTTLTTSTRTLVTAVPELVVKAVVDAYAAAPTSAPVSMVTTLPFGMGATVELSREHGEELELKSPAFSATKLEGALQLAASAKVHTDGTPSSFAGGLRQFEGLGVSPDRIVNARAMDAFTSSWSPDPTSVADFVDADFASEVPVSRLDVSGRGGSCFSRWSDPDAMAQVGKVELRVLVGRCALEVIKVVSILHPWGILVTRTVTIERRGGGGVIRRDSGWQAASDGLFRFPSARDPHAPAPSPADAYRYPVEPGLLRGLFDVRNLHVTDGAPIAFDGDNGHVELVPLLFDADAQLDGLDKRVPAQAVLGLLQMQPTGAGQFPTTADLAKVFDLLRDPDTGDLGTIGGRLDAELSLASTNLRFRARRLEVGMRDGTTLIGVVRGTPIFRQAGNWGVARRLRAADGSANEASHVEDARGVPLVAAGQLDPNESNAKAIAVSGTPRPLQFRDPEDLHKSRSEARREYGFLQSSPAHALFFPDPVLAHHATEIIAASRPEIADSMLRATTKAIFPARDHVITLPEFPLRLASNGSFSSPGEIVWHPPPAGVRIPIAPDASSSVAYVGGSGDAHTTVRLSFDDTAWSVRIEPVLVWSDALGAHDTYRTSMRVHAGSGETPMLREVSTKVGNAIGELLQPFSWFSTSPQTRDIDLTATNSDPVLTIGFGLHGEFNVSIVAIELGVEFGSDIRCGLPMTGRFEVEAGAEIAIGGGFHVDVGAILKFFTEFHETHIVGPYPPPDVSPSTTDIFELTVYAGLGWGTGGDDTPETSTEGGDSPSGTAPSGTPAGGSPSGTAAAGSASADVSSSSGGSSSSVIEISIDAITGPILSIEHGSVFARWFLEADFSLNIFWKMPIVAVHASVQIALSGAVGATSMEQLHLGEDGKKFYSGPGQYVTGWGQFLLHVEVFVVLSLTLEERVPIGIRLS